MTFSDLILRFMVVCLTSLVGNLLFVVFLGAAFNYVAGKRPSYGLIYAGAVCAACAGPLAALLIAFTLLEVHVRLEQSLVTTLSICLDPVLWPICFAVVLTHSNPPFPIGFWRAFWVRLVAIFISAVFLALGFLVYFGLQHVVTSRPAPPRAPIVEDADPFVAP